MSPALSPEILRSPVGNHRVPPPHAAHLNPEREAIFQELARVLRQNGVVYAAELILREPLAAAVRNDPGSWFS